MNGQNNTSTDSLTATHRFMAAKKETPLVTQAENVSLSADTLPENDPQQEVVTDSKPKDTARKKRSGSSLNYIDTFLCRYELSSRQGLHLEKGTIATIKRIIHSIGDERLTVSGFVENVLKHHFELYKEEVNRLYDEKLRKPIE